MIPFGELPRLKDNLFDTFGIEDKIFVRPDSPIKLFTGQTIQRQTFDKDYDYLGFYDFPQKRNRGGKLAQIRRCRMAIRHCQWNRGNGVTVHAEWKFANFGGFSRRCVFVSR